MSKTIPLTMLAFHDDPAIKAKYLARVRMHRLSDNLTQCVGWDLGKGCAVGCTLERYEHGRYPVELGIPVHLAYLEDRLFELLSSTEAKMWPERFLSAIRPGADLSGVWPAFAVWMLVDPTIGVLRHLKGRRRDQAVVRCVAKLWKRGCTATEHKRVLNAADVSTVLAAYYAEAARDYADYTLRAVDNAAGYYAAGTERQRWASVACDKLISLLEAA